MRLSTVERQQFFGENMDFKVKISKESPEDREQRIREALSVYTDEELEKMSFAELADLCGRIKNTINNRVTRNKMGRREACICETVPEQYSQMSKRREKSPLFKAAKKYGVSYSSLSSARYRHPNKHIEVLAQEIKERKLQKQGKKC